MRWTRCRAPGLGPQVRRCDRRPGAGFGPDDGVRSQDGGCARGSGGQEPRDLGSLVGVFVTPGPPEDAAFLLDRPGACQTDRVRKFSCSLREAAAVLPVLPPRVAF